MFSNRDVRAGRRLSLIEAPSNLGLQPPSPGREPGVRRLPEALARAGLGAKLPVAARTRVEPPPYDGAIDAATGIRNAPAVADYSRDLARRVGEAIDAGEFPLVLGGDCSILLGALLALRRRGRYGLFFLDGHADFATPETSASRGAAGMDLLLATGRGPALLSNLDGLAPLVRDEDVTVLGYRDRERLPGSIAARDVVALRLAGIEGSARRQVEALERQGARGFWIHVDADVLDPTILPAVDTPEPGGLGLGELATLLRELLRSGAAVGMQLCIYDPDLDPEGTGAGRLVELLAGVFSDGDAPAARRRARGARSGRLPG
jgi:arginase